LRECLASIRAQDYPADRLEIIVADAGSSDDTLAIAEEHAVDRVVENPRKTGEAGKSEGIRVAGGEIVALVDSDNILEGNDWLSRLTAPFEDEEISIVEPLRFTYRPQDPALVRYFALLGMNDPVCLFTGNYDRYSAITDTWTEMPVDAEDKGDYLKLRARGDALPTMGANGILFRRSLLEHVAWEPYFSDIDFVYDAVTKTRAGLAKVKTGIVHLFCTRLADFGRKQNRRVRDFLFFSARRERKYPWTARHKRGILRFCVYSACVVPLMVQMVRGYRRCADKAWWYHVPVCEITLFVYASAVIGGWLGVKPRIGSRERWQQ